MLNRSKIRRAAGLAMAVASLASLPGIAQAAEVGHCVRAEGVKVGKKTVYSGGYKEAKCVKTVAAHNGKWEWDPGVTKTGFTFDSNQGTAHLFFGVILGARDNQAVVRCESEHGAGTVTGPTTVADVTMRFTGCTCTTPGLAAGEVEPAVMSGSLDNLNPPSGETFMVADCGYANFVFKGGLAASLNTSKQELRFTARPSLTTLEELPENGEILEETMQGLGMTAALTFEEPVHLRG